MSAVAPELSDADFLEAVVQNDYLIDGHVLPTGVRLRAIADALRRPPRCDGEWHSGYVLAVGCSKCGAKSDGKGGETPPTKRPYAAPRETRSQGGPSHVVCHEPGGGVAKTYPHLAWTVRGLPSGFCHGWFPTEGQARSYCDSLIAAETDGAKKAEPS